MGSTYTLKEILTYAIHDEYLAYAEYSKILEAYGSTMPFSNIIKAEQSHITALENLFAGLGIATPNSNASAYVTIPTSVAECLNAGILENVNNIAMYEKFLAQGLPDAVRSVFIALKNASESHLAAFEQSLSSEGGSQARNGISKSRARQQKPL